MKIRKADPSEYKNYINLRKEGKKYFSKISKERIIISDKKIKEEFLAPLKNKKNKIFFIEENEKIIGYLNILLIPKKEGKVSYLGDIIITEKFRKKGLGEKAMKWFIEFSKKQKAKKIGLGARIENKPAIKLYKKLGFKEIGINFGMKIK